MNERNVFADRTCFTRMEEFLEKKNHIIYRLDWIGLLEICFISMGKNIVALYVRATPNTIGTPCTPSPNTIYE